MNSQCGIVCLFQANVQVSLNLKRQNLIYLPLPHLFCSIPLFILLSSFHRICYCLNRR